MGVSYPEAIRLIEERGLGIRPDLHRIKALMALLDNPQQGFPSVHLTGTNGKSSTARMVGAILAAHGLKAGVYTSPHLQTIRERFVVTGPVDGGADSSADGSRYAKGGGIAEELIAPEELALTVGYLLPFVEMVENGRDESVTYFELSTAVAFEWMAQKAVAVGVVEVGMGGSWDATNVIDAQVAVLTPIAVDHARFLGPTPLDNAREKVGIIRPGARVVSAAQDPDVLDFIESKTGEIGACLALFGRDFSVRSDQLVVSGRVLAIEGARGLYEDIFLPMHGSHQSANAALAVAACEEFVDRQLDPDSLRRGLSTVKLSGRMEVVATDPLVVLDGAHNPAGADALARALAESFRGRRTNFVVSILEDKDTEAILTRLLPQADRTILTRSSHPRAADPQRLASCADVPVEVVESLPEAINRALEDSGACDMVVICGSLYAVGEARDHLVGALP